MYKEICLVDFLVYFLTSIYTNKISSKILKFFNCSLYTTYCVSLIRRHQACRKEKNGSPEKKKWWRPKKKLLFKVQTYKFQDVDEEFEENWKLW